MNPGYKIENKYEIVEKIGSDGVDIVYRGKQLSNNQTVIIRSINPALAQESEFKDHVIKEAEILRNLNHRNIARVIDFVEEPGNLLLISELPEGKTLDRFIGKGAPKIPIQKALPLFTQIVEGINYLHENGAVHRNLRPENIFVFANNEIRISGFSVSPAEGSFGKTKVSNKKETMFYLSPEQIIRERCDERTDVYSLGIILYEILAGSLPFGNKGKVSEFSLMNEILSNSFNDPRQFNPSIPEWLVELIRRATAKKKEERIQRVSEILAALRNGEIDLQQEITILSVQEKEIGFEDEPKEKIVHVPRIEEKIHEVNKPLPRKKILSISELKSAGANKEAVEMPSAHIGTKKEAKAYKPAKKKKSHGWRNFFIFMIMLSALLYYGYINLPELEPVNPALKSTFQIIGYSSGVQSVAFSPDGIYVVGGTVGETIYAWDVFTGNQVNNLKGHENVMSIAFSPDGKYLASGSREKSVKLWDFAKSSELKTFKGHNGWIYSVTFSPDGKLLASGSNDKTIKLWDVATGKMIINLAGHKDGVTSVAFSHDGKYLASGSMDNTIKLWDLTTGKEVHFFQGHDAAVYTIAFSHDGKFLASGGHDNNIKIWDVSTGTELKTLTGHSRSVNSVSFSPDGKYLASGSDDYSIKLWDTSSWKELKTLTGKNYIMSVAFSPDGKLLASGSEENNVKLWEINAVGNPTVIEKLTKQIEKLIREGIKRV